METVEAYFERKADELRLLSSCLRQPLPVRLPQSIGDVIQQKFRLTAALKADHNLRDWSGTETAWAPTQHRNGPFEFTYDYQRADIHVRGPAFYDLDGISSCQTVYTGSGMAAIAAVFLAAAKISAAPAINIPLGSYGETQELAENYLGQLNLFIDHKHTKTAADFFDYRILLGDSSLPW